jgi:hypothetical protein
MVPIKIDRLVQLFEVPLPFTVAVEGIVDKNAVLHSQCPDKPTIRP